ncbi:hypothetical protein ACFX1R_004023 [Malus domestica]
MSNNVQKAPIGEQNDGQDDLENDIDNNDGLDDVADAKTPYDDDEELLPPGHEEDRRDEEIINENFTQRRELDVERERIANLLTSSLQLFHI